MYSYSWPAPRSNWSVVSFLLLGCFRLLAELFKRGCRWRNSMKMCIVVEEFWCNDVHFAILLLYPSIRKTVHVRPWMRSTFKNNPLRMKKKIMCSVWYWNQSRNEISMSVILDFMNTAVPNCQGCRRSKGNACWTYILVFQISYSCSNQVSLWKWFCDDPIAWLCIHTY